MSEFEMKKIISNKNRLLSRDAASVTRSASSRGNNLSRERESAICDIKQPTILLKARDSSATDDSSVNIKRKARENETSIHTIKESPEAGVPTLKQMTKSMKLLDEGVINTESLQDYLHDNSDFMVVGVVGAQGVGKSTILNLLAEQKVECAFNRKISTTETGAVHCYENGIKLINTKLESTHLDKQGIFKVQSLDDIEKCVNTTLGIDIYVSTNRVIFLDCQPCLSVSVMDDLIESENKRSNLVSEFMALENSGEIQGLQYASFLMSVCHILLVVQDWFFNSNIVRFIQTAEMLKPTISNSEDEYSEHFPHLIMIQNRASMGQFTPKQFRVMQKVYYTLFQKTKLQFHSNLGLASGRIMNTLDDENCGNQVNLFLIPDKSESENDIYCGHPPLEELVKKLKANLFGATKNPLTHVQLTEKTWLIYCNKVWETVKKSPFFVEYSKLMP